MAFRTAPLATTKMPPGIPFIVGNEAAERYSFYGMKSILVVFMTQYLADAAGNADRMSKPEATEWAHLFMSATYFFPLVGAFISDGLWGKYATIMRISLLYCVGHAALALDHTRAGLLVGLTLIALGAGGIKPCVSAHVGDQFGERNQHLMERVFGWFYVSINVGAALAYLITPRVLEDHGPAWAFGIPGALMGLATLIFWLGRHRYAHIPPAGRRFVQESFQPEGLKAIARLLPLYAFVAVFWSLYDQTGSTWVLQAEHMNRDFLGVTWLPAQIGAVNPILILLFVPLFSYGVYPLAGRLSQVTPLRKIGAGLFLTVPSFLIAAWVEQQIQAGGHPSIGWQLLAYVTITAAEILVSVTCLEFAYTQAPVSMKSLVMGLYWCSVAAGNLFTALVNHFIQLPDGSTRLAGADYYLFFSAIMAGASVLFVPMAIRFKERTYIHATTAAE